MSAVGLLSARAAENMVRGHLPSVLSLVLASLAFCPFDSVHLFASSNMPVASNKED